MILVDATVWVDLLQKIESAETVWLTRNIPRERIGLADLTLCEVLQGIREDNRFSETQSILSRFDVLATGGEELALSAARNYRTLRARGITVRGTIDCILATFCIQNDHLLLHRDRDFHPFRRYLGLRTIDTTLMRVE